MELWLKKIFILFPWLIARASKPILPEDHPVKDWTWSDLAENGTDLLYFFAGSMWFCILSITISLILIFRR